MIHTVRIALLDQPGMLGAIAAALSHAGANILNMHVVDVEEGIAVDDFVVEMQDGGAAEELRRTVEEVPGALVEAIKPLEAAPGLLAPLELAAELATRSETVLLALVRGLPHALASTWAAAIHISDGRVEILAASVGAPPSLKQIETPWMPLERPRRLPEAEWMPPAWRMRRYDLVAAPLYDSASAVVVARARGPRFRAAEIRQLELLVRIVRAAGAKQSPAHRRLSSPPL